MESNWTEIAQGIGSLASAVISLVGFVFVWRQIKQTNSNLRQSNHTAIYSINTEIHKFFAENSELRPYFHDEKPLLPDDENRNKIFSISELLADFFEYILVEKDSLAPEIREPWKIYMNKIYSKSSAFRQFIHTNKDQYSDALLTLFAETKVDYHDLVLSVREIKDDTDFKKLDDLYQSCFGQSSVPTETQKKWWTAYPKGIIGLYFSKELIGGLSYWPVNAKTFEKLKLGQLREREISVADFDTVRPQHFYISEIAIKEEFRQKYYANLLLKNFFICVEPYLTNMPIKISAFEYSSQGSKILHHLGFVKQTDAENTPDKQAFFVLTIKSKSELDILKKRLV